MFSELTFFLYIYVHKVAKGILYIYLYNITYTITHTYKNSAAESRRFMYFVHHFFDANFWNVFLPFFFQFFFLYGMYIYIFYVSGCEAFSYAHSNILWLKRWNVRSREILLNFHICVCVCVCWPGLMELERKQSLLFLGHECNGIYKDFGVCMWLWWSVCICVCVWWKLLCWNLTFSRHLLAVTRFV